MLIRLVWLSLGMFAIGTEGFMIAGLLPVISDDLGVTVAAAGQLVTVFALVYAFSSPVTATLMSGVERRRVLLISITGFLLANLLAAAATSYPMLMAARVLLAISAGLYSPSASAFAGNLVAPEQRGRALAIVVGGVSAAVALGAPLGTLVGTLLGWRFTFVAVAGLCAAALIGIAWRLPTQVAGPRVTLGERIRTARQRDVGFALLTTLFWGMGGFTVYTFTAPLLESVAQWRGVLLSAVLLAFGIGAVGGTALGGVVLDRFRPARWQALALGGLALLSIGLSVAASLLPLSTEAGVLVMAIYAGWGILGWSFHPAQQLRLMSMAPHAVPTVLSLNQSAMYLGMALGATAGGFTLRWGSPAELGWVAATWQLSALVMLGWGLRRTAGERASGVTGAAEKRSAA